MRYDIRENTAYVFSDFISYLLIHRAIYRLIHRLIHLLFGLGKTNSEGKSEDIFPI